MDGPRPFSSPCCLSASFAVRTAVVALCLGCAPSAAWGQSMRVNTAAMAAGSPPADFEFARTGSGHIGAWQVVNDDTSKDGRAIEQTNTDATDYRFPLAIYKST